MDLDNIVTVNWPAGNEVRYRFVQLYLIDGKKRKPVIRYAESNDEPPEDILQKFLDSNGIKFKTITKKGRKIPVLKGKNYEASGMGYSVVSREDHGIEASFFGSIIIYGDFGLDEEHLKLIEELEPDAEFKYLRWDCSTLSSP